MLSFSFNFNCTTYLIGKSSRSTVFSLKHASTTSLDLIFNDVWGYSSIFLVERYHYFVVLWTILPNSFGFTLYMLN